MNQIEIQALESYKAQAATALAQDRQARAAQERADEERRAHELAEQWALVRAHVAEIVPPELWPLLRFTEDEQSPRNNVRIEFVEGDAVILRMFVYVQANMEVRLEQLKVPDVRILDGDEGWKALLLYDGYNYRAIKTVDGFCAQSDQNFNLAIARAYEQLATLREFEAEAAAHNAEQAERQAATPPTAEAIPHYRDTFRVIEADSRGEFSYLVGECLNEDWQLHGPTQVVMQLHPEYDTLIPVYYQALVRDPEVF